MNTKHINGLTVNVEAIGSGIYKIICERGEESVVAFGMIPKWSMDILNKLLREKVLSEARKQANITEMTDEELAPYIDQKKLTETVNAIEHEVCIAIYQAASKAGKMVA